MHPGAVVNLGHGELVHIGKQDALGSFLFSWFHQR
jgi:hypothetical protein